MTFDILQKIIKENNIPSNVHLTSDSGWECDATEMNGVYYNEAENEIVFTQNGNKYDHPYHDSEEWKNIYSAAEDCKITFPNKVPVHWNFDRLYDPRPVIGDANIVRDDKGLVCEVNLTTDLLTEDEYYVGGYYTNVKRHDENSICVIDACALRSMSIVLAPADKSLKIRKEENNV